MKAICIKQPWAQLILDGYKTIELRSWRVPDELLGEPVLLCASGSPHGVKLPADGDSPEVVLPSGCALAVVCFTECEPFTHDMAEAAYSDWSSGLLAWKVGVVAHVKPFAMKGKLKFFDVPDDLIIEIGNDDHVMNYISKDGEIL